MSAMFRPAALVAAMTVCVPGAATAASLTFGPEAGPIAASGGAGSAAPLAGGVELPPAIVSQQGGLLSVSDRSLASDALGAVFDAGYLPTDFEVRITLAHGDAQSEAVGNLAAFLLGQWTPEATGEVTAVWAFPAAPQFSAVGLPEGVSGITVADPSEVSGGAASAPLPATVWAGGTLLALLGGANWARRRRQGTAV